MSLEILCRDYRLSGCVSFAAIALGSPVVFCANPYRKLVSTFSNASGALKWQSDGAAQTIAPQCVFTDGTYIHAIGVGLWYRINSANVVQATAAPYNLTNPTWGFAASPSYVVVPFAASGVQTLNATTGAPVSSLPDITSTIALAVGGNGYVYCFNQDRAVMTILAVDANGILTLANSTRISVPNGHRIRGALIDGSTLVVVTDHRVLTFSLTDPTAPAFSTTTTVTQTIRGVGIIAAGRYWLATDETVPVQQQPFQLPTVALLALNGVLVSFSPAQGAAENTPTVFDFRGVATPPPAGTPPVAPTILPGTGSYGPTQTASITAPNGGTIYFTLDGTTPTNASTPYTVPFTVTVTTTIKAIIYASGYPPTAVTTATMTFSTYADGLRFIGIAATSYTGLTSDGTTFVAQPGAGASSTRLNAIGMNPGTGTVIFGNNGGQVVRTTDGSTWVAAGPAGFSSTTDVRYAFGAWWALTNSNTLFKSTDDGVTWGTVNHTFAGGYVTALCFTNGFLVACVDTNLFTTPDGITWTAQTNPGLSAAGTCADIVFAFSKYWLGTRNSSANGGVWFASAISGPWTQVTFPGAVTNGLVFTIRLLNGILYAAMNVAATTKLYSTTDGVAWTSQAIVSPASLIQTMAYFANKWWLADQGTTVQNSTDGSTWANVTPTGQSGTQVATLFYRPNA